MKYEIVDTKISGKEFDMKIEEGIAIYPKMSEFSIDKMMLYDEKIIEYTITQKFLKKYKKIIKSFLLLDETGEDGIVSLLGDIQRIEEIILNKYKKHMKIEKIKKMLKELYIVEQETKKKYTYIYNYELENTINKSR